MQPGLSSQARADSGHAVRCEQTWEDHMTVLWFTFLVCKIGLVTP